jgi:haloalkane dehalogenase
MSYVDMGSGQPVVFLHGNPTWSYLWRNVIPHVGGTMRCLAPDLIGMGQSGKSPPGAYRFVDHARYLDACFDAVLTTAPVVLVVHDWGSALGFYWASRHRARVRAIAYMEAIVQPRVWSDFPPSRDEAFRNLRSPKGETLILDDNFFIEHLLPRSVIRPLTDQEMDAYRAPFRNRSDRWPMLVWPRELPIEGQPADVVRIVQEYGAWLAASDVPKLFINAEHGALIGSRAREFCRSWPHQDEVTVKGIHYVQEDSPAEIGAALQRFLAELRL